MRGVEARCKPTARRFGPIELREQNEVANVLRTDTPTQIRIESFATSELSTDARKPRLRALSSRIHRKSKVRSDAGVLDLSGRLCPDDLGRGSAVRRR
jgi:hypothetical protein